MTVLFSGTQDLAAHVYPSHMAWYGMVWPGMAHTTGMAYQAVQVAAGLSLIEWAMDREDREGP